MRAKAKVLKPLNPEGRVQVHGEIWKAVSFDALRKNEFAEVVGVDGLTLQVRRWQDRREERPTSKEQSFESWIRRYSNVIRSSLRHDCG